MLNYRNVGYVIYQIYITFDKNICAYLFSLPCYFSGDGCIDKPLATLWKNHIGTDKPSIVMKVTVCGSGLKAVTKEHGLTEYWANRITYSAADPAYPKVFCWIYRYV